MLFKKINIVVCLCLLAIGLSAQTTFSVDAGPYRKICPGTSTTLGGNPTASGGSGNYQYVWHPGKHLSDSTISKPIATPNTTTTYTVFVTDTATRKIDTATVTVYVYPYYVNAGHDTTIRQGQTITLHGQVAPGDSSIWWKPQHGSMYNQNSLSPDFFSQIPGKDSVLLTVNFYHGCVFYDYLIITVLPSTELFFYNSFSPNGDGANDVFYIGNLNLYPNSSIEIYNRYGQKVLTKTPYENDWNGTYLGTELPCGTYFYILDTHDDKAGKYKGEVTIIR